MDIVFPSFLDTPDLMVPWGLVFRTPALQLKVVAQFSYTPVNILLSPFLPLPEIDTSRFMEVHVFKPFVCTEYWYNNERVRQLKLYFSSTLGLFSYLRLVVSVSISCLVELKNMFLNYVLSYVSPTLF